MTSQFVDGVQLQGGYTERIQIDDTSPAWPDNFIHFPVAGAVGAKTPPATNRLVAATPDRFQAGPFVWAVTPTSGVPNYGDMIKVLKQPASCTRGSRDG